MIIYEVRKNGKIIGAFSDIDKAYELGFLTGGTVTKRKCVLRRKDKVYREWGRWISKKI